MKKILIIIFLATIMLIAPMTTAIKTTDPSTYEGETPEFEISQEDLNKIYLFIETYFEEEADKNLAYDIVNDIIGEDLKFDLLAFADAVQEYGFQEIPEEEINATYDIAVQQGLQAAVDYLNSLVNQYWNIINGELSKDLFGQLIDKIMDLVIDRLGWTYEFFNESASLFVEGVNLVVNYIKPALVVIAVSVVKVINDILAIPKLFSDLIKQLFNLEFQAFIDEIIEFTENTAQDFAALIQDVNNLVNNQTISNYLYDLEGFFTWLDGKPWEEGIEVTGVVKKNFAVLSGATVTCRGQTTTTDENGRYSFTVDVIPDNDSFPPNVYYGMHNCQITVSNNGEVLKISPAKLSYVFSGGKIDWAFAAFSSKPKDTGFKSPLISRLYNILEWVYSLFPQFFQNLQQHQCLVKT